MNFNRIFDPENVVFRNLARLVDLVCVSLLWLACCVPLLTIGPATAALYHTAVRCVIQRQGSTYQTFFHSLRANLRVGIPVTAMALAIGAVLLWGYQVMIAVANARGGAAVAAYVAYCVMLVVPVGVLCWAFPLLSRFQMSVRQLLFTSLQVALRHLPSTVILVLLLMEMVQAGLQFLPAVAVLPVTTALLDSLFIERVIRKYAPEAVQSDEDKE